MIISRGQESEANESYNTLYQLVYLHSVLIRPRLSFLHIPKMTHVFSFFLSRVIFRKSQFLPVMALASSKCKSNSWTKTNGTFTVKIFFVLHCQELLFMIGQ